MPLNAWPLLRKVSNETRFWRLVDIKTDDECWPWKGNTDPNGYGRFSLGGKLYLARRCAYALTKGNLKPEERVGASCRMPGCVNPNHLSRIKPKVSIYEIENPSFERSTEVWARQPSASYGHKHQ